MESSDDLSVHRPVQATDLEPLIKPFPQHISVQPESGSTQSLPRHLPQTRPTTCTNDAEAYPPAFSASDGLHSAAANDGERSESASVDVEVEDNSSTPDVYCSSPYFKYRNLVGSISQKLRKENALRLAYVYDLPTWYYEVGPTYDPSSALRVLIALEGKGVFSPNNLSGLSKALEYVEREDLAQSVRDFRSKVAMETVAKSNTFPQQVFHGRSVVGSVGGSGRRAPRPVHSISTTSLMPMEDTNVYSDGKVYRSCSKPDLERHSAVHGGEKMSAIDGDLHQSSLVEHDKSIHIGLQFALMSLSGLEKQIKMLNDHVDSTVHGQNLEATFASNLRSLLDNATCSVSESTRHIESACSLVGAGRLGSAGEPPLSARSTPVREFDHQASFSSSRKFSRSGSGGAVAMSRQSSRMSMKDKMTTSFSSSTDVDARKKLSFDRSVDKDGSSLGQHCRHGHSLSGYTKLTQDDFECENDVSAPHPGQMHATPPSGQVRIKRRWSRRDGKRLSRKGVLVWQIKVKKIKEWYSQKDISLDSEDFYDVCKRKFKATLHPFGLGDDCGSYMTLCINCLDDIKPTQKVSSTDIIVRVIDPQSTDTPIQPICRQLERRGIRVIQRFISHAQVDKFLSDVIVVTVALKSEAPSDDSDINEPTESIV